MGLDWDINVNIKFLKFDADKKPLAFLLTQPQRFNIFDIIQLQLLRFIP